MNDPVILDASAWVAVLLQEENSGTLTSLIQNHALFAPELIRYEAANGILFAYRRRRLSSKKPPLEHLLEIVSEFPIETVPVSVWWKTAIRLIHTHSLTFYDAAYLAAASALRMPLLTLDGELRQVMKDEKILEV